MQNDYAQLLIDVQKKSKITVNKSRDLRFLKEEIEENPKLSIGFNTLRRLFGFLEKTEPSISTLNILAVYLGLFLTVLTRVILSIMIIGTFNKIYKEYNLQIR